MTCNKQFKYEYICSQTRKGIRMLTNQKRKGKKPILLNIILSDTMGMGANYNLQNNRVVPQVRCNKVRAVKTGYLARVELAHDGFGLWRARPQRPRR